MVLQLFASEESYALLKIKAVISLLGLKAEDVVVALVTAEELLQKEPAAKTVTLVTESDAITQVNEIVRHLASLPVTKDVALSLLGKSAEAAAEIDSWLSISWNKLEIPLQALLGLSSGKPEFQLTPNDRIKVEQKAYADIEKALKAFDRHLSTRTFFVGEALSVVDVAVFSALTAAVKFSVVDKEFYPSVYRWFMTVGAVVANAGAFDFSPLAATVKETTTGEAKTGGKWLRHRIRVKELLALGDRAIGREVTVKGWVRTSRSAEKGQTLFVELNDGSSSRSVQLVLTASSTVGLESVAVSGGVHASISVKGKVVPSPAKGQAFEIAVTSAQVLGPVYGGENGEIGGKNYPMAKKQHTLEFLREKAHLRPRSKVFSAAVRVRHAMAFATHKFFNERGFCYVHTPLITAADCEGAGELFAVTTLFPESGKVKDIPTDKNGNIDFSKDFFSKRSSLTVSGQLNVETHACALSDVYTFGPTFRAEDSHTARHLAEFWMIEPEICFADLADDMALAEDYVRYCAAYALEHCADDLAYFENEYPAGEKGLTDRLKNVVESDFAQITYTEAVDILQREIAEGRVVFERYPNWGDDLGSEHERYITEKIYKKPTIVINYPKGIKAFYMKVNDDDATVAAMDILVPKIGELIGGSQREDRLDVLERRCLESNLKLADLWWYLDLRRYGTVPHAGFGLGFERLIMFITGLENIRDVIPFPRVPGHADF